MSIFLGVLAVSLLSQGNASSTATPAAPSAEAQTADESEAVRSALDWLALSDQGRWKDGWLAAGGSFKKLNTAERWAAAAEKVRQPLGALVSRTELSHDWVPAPPAGVEVIKFRSSFANRSNVIETVSLAREGGRWKVVGIHVD